MLLVVRMDVQKGNTIMGGSVHPYGERVNDKRPIGCAARLVRTWLRALFGVWYVSMCAARKHIVILLHTLQQSVRGVCGHPAIRFLNHLTSTFHCYVPLLITLTLLPTLRPQIAPSSKRQRACL